MYFCILLKSNIFVVKEHTFQLHSSEYFITMYYVLQTLVEMSKSATEPYLNARGVLHGMCRHSKGERTGTKNKVRTCTKMDSNTD